MTESKTWSADNLQWGPPSGASGKPMMPTQMDAASSAPFKSPGHESFWRQGLLTEIANASA
jgi:hypothetical protein